MPTSSSLVRPQQEVVGKGQTERDEQVGPTAQSRASRPIGLRARAMFRRYVRVYVCVCTAMR